MKNNLMKSSIGILVIALVLVSTGASSVFADFFRTVGHTFTAPSDSSEYKYGYGYGDSGWGYGYGYGYGYTPTTTTTTTTTTTGGGGGGGYSSSTYHPVQTNGGLGVTLDFSNPSDSIDSISDKLVSENSKYHSITVVVKKIYSKIHVLAISGNYESIEKDFKEAYSKIVNSIISGNKDELKNAIKEFIAVYNNYKKALDSSVIKEYNLTKLGHKSLLFRTPIFRSEKMNQALTGFDKKAAKYITKHISNYGNQVKAVEALNNLLLALRGYKEGDRVESLKLIRKYMEEFNSYLD